MNGISVSGKKKLMASLDFVRYSRDIVFVQCATCEMIVQTCNDKPVK